MNDLNDVIIEGRLGDDPFFKEGENGAWASFSMAVNESYKDKSGEWVEKTSWISVMTYKKLAEIVGSKIAKGDHVTVKGKFQTRSYTNKQDQKVWITEVVANFVRKNNRSAKVEDNAGVTNSETEKDDLPF